MSELQQQGLMRLCCAEKNPERIAGISGRLLKDGGNIDLWKGHSYIGQLLYHAGQCGAEPATQVRCLQILRTAGANFNTLDEDGYAPLDYVAWIPNEVPFSPESLFESVKFVLKKGGKCYKRREQVIRKMEYYGGMTREQFEGFEKIGRGETVTVDENMDLKKSETLRLQQSWRVSDRYSVQETKHEIARLEKELADKKQYLAKTIRKLRQGTPERHFEAWKKKVIAERHIDYMNV